MSLRRAILGMGTAAMVMAGAFLPAWAQTPTLIQEAFSREYSLFAGGDQTPAVKTVTSREVSIFVGAEPVPAYAQAVSREISVLVTTPTVPQRITQLTTRVSPTGDSAMLDWSGYNEVAQSDVVKYLVYISSSPFTTISNLTPFAIVPAGTSTLSVSNLTQWQDHYFAVVAVDALGGYDSVVNYSAAYVIAPQAISREFSLFIGGETAPAYNQALSREVSVLVTTPMVPSPITNTQLVITVTPTGDGATLDWSAYNEIAQNDVVKYNVFISDTLFTTVSNLVPFATVPAGTFTLTVSNLTAWQDHYFAVVPVDGLGGYDSFVNYSAAYVIAAQATSREFSLFVGGSPAAGDAETVSREVSILVPDSMVPAPVTGLTNGFVATTSVSAYSAIDLNWSSYNEVAQNDVVRYLVYVGTSFFTDVSTLSPYQTVPAGTFHCTVHGLYGGDIYYVAVVAVGALGNFNPTVRAASAQASIGALGDVQNLRVTSASNSLAFTWTPPTEVDAFLAHYNIYFNGATDPTPLVATATSYNATELQFATGYPFRISTVDTFGNESAGVSLLAATLLSNPSPIITQTFDQIVRLTWTQVEPNNLVQTYSVYASSTPFSNVAGMTPVLTTRGIRGDVGGLVDGTPYYFAVTTVNLVNGENQVVQAVTATPNPVTGTFADLEVTNVTAPASVYGGQSVTIRWAVTNLGSSFTSTLNGTPVNTWSDEVVFSPNNVFGITNDLVLTNVVHTGALGIGGSYEGMTTCEIPTNLVGSFDVFVMINANGAVYEGLDYGSDLGEAPQPLVISPPVAPYITQQPQSQTVYQGGMASFSVAAQGLIPLAYQWQHGSTVLPAGTNASLVLTNVQFADAGSYAVRVSNAAGSTNSSTALLIVNPPPPDLFTVGLQSPTNVQAGQPLLVSWLVTNAGGSTAVAPWQETVYLASNPAGTNGTLLFNYDVTNSQPAGTSGLRMQSAIIPAGLAGNYWLALQVDSANQVAGNAGKTNNLFVAPQPIWIQSPDLSMVWIASPATASFGQPFTVSWAVTNSGNGPATASWLDRAWLSSSSGSIAGAQLLASVPAAASPLPAGGFYTNTRSLTVPLTAPTQPGNYWLILQADALNAVPEADETNNLLAVPLALTLPPLPDLVVGDVSSPASALAGQAISVSWAVTNLGAATASGIWQEAIYLVPAGVPLAQFNTNVAVYPLAGTFSYTNSLAVGQSVLRTQSVTIPLTGSAGDVRVGVVVNSGNNLVEQAETNNTALAMNDLQVPLALTLSVPVTNVVKNTPIPGLNCLVSRNGDLSAPVLVVLGDTATNLLQVPASLTIPGGVATAPFTVTVRDDGVPGPNTLVTLAANADNYLGATSQVLVVNSDLPSLTLTLGMPHITEGQTVSATVTSSTINSQPVVVSIASSSSTALSVPTAVTIPAYSNSVAFTVLAVQSTVIAPAQSYTLSVATSGYNGATASLVVFNDNTPTITLALDRTNINKGEGPFAAVATISRQPVTDQAVTLALASTNPFAALVPAQVTIPALQATTTFPVAAVNDTNVRGPQTTLISAQALDVDGNAVGEPATELLTVQDDTGPVLQLAVLNTVVTKGANPATTGIVWIAEPITNDLRVSLTSSETNEATVPASVTILAGQTNASFAIVSLNDGRPATSQTLSITASAKTYAPASAVLTVTDISLPDLAIASINAPGTAFTGEPFTLDFRMINQGLGPMTNNVTQNAYLTTNPVSGSYLLIGSTSFSGPLAPGQYVDESLVVPGSAVPLPGTYWVVITADAGNAAVELDEANNSSASSTPTVVSLEYTATVTAGVTNVVAGTPVPLSGSATLVGGGPAANKPVNLLLTVRGLPRELSVVTDSHGNFSTIFTPLASEAGYYTVAAVVPGITSAPAQAQFTIVGAVFTPTPLAVTVLAGGNISVPVTLQNLSEVPLSGLTASLSGVAANLNASATFATNYLAGQSNVTLNVVISAGNANALQSSFTVQFASNEGVALMLPVNVTVVPLVAQLATAPGQLSATMLPGQQTVLQFEVANLGGAPSGPLTVSAPAVPWLSIASTNPLPSLNPGQSNLVTIVLTPDATLALGPYTGALTISGSGLGLAVPFIFDCVSDAHGAVLVESVDELTFFAAGSPPLTNASVTLIEPFSGSIMATGLTDTAGQLLLTNVAAGTYELDVTANQHAGFKGSATVTAGKTNAVQTFLSLQTVTYTWTVVPTQIQDQTLITVQAEFEANVPAPVVVPSPASIDVGSLQQPGQFIEIPLTLANYGLIAVQDVTLNISQNSQYQIDVLAQNLGDLPAHGTVTVPMRITRLASAHASSGNPCTISLSVGYLFLCGQYDVSTGIPIPIFNVSGDCGGGGSGSVVTVGCSGCSGFGGPVIIPPGKSLPTTCDQCMAKAILECAIGYTPAGCAYGTWSCVAGLSGGVNESSTENCVVQGVGCMGPIGNTAACLWSFLRCKCNGPLASVPSCVKQALGSGHSARDDSVGLGLSPVDPRDVYVARSYPSLEMIQLLFGDTNGDWFSPGSGGQFGIWFNAYVAAIQSGSPAGALISPEEETNLLTLPRPDSVSSTEVQAALDRWNLSLNNWRAGIYYLTNVPPGGNTNFIDLGALSELAAEIDQENQVAQAAGYADPVAGFFAAIQAAESELGGGGTCAHVVLQLDQQAVLTRDAFKATLQISNTGSQPMQNISVNLTVQNAAGQDVTSLLGIEPPTFSGSLTAADGTGLLPPNGTGSAQWTLIPTLDAAPQAPTNYLVSGTFSYSLNGVTITIPLSPSPISVEPSPQLYLKYFLQRDVFADDPYTPEIEPSIPFPLAVMVQNKGYGAADNFHITSAQPTIVDNQKGLLISFKIISTQIAGQPATPSLTANFGDLAPGAIKIGEWWMISSLEGLFINYAATYQHIDPLGNPRLSLIQGVEIHQMTHLVQAEGGWDDGQPDFLVNDIANLQSLPDTLYLSDGTTQPVSVVQTATTDGAVTANHLQVHLTANFPAGFTYLLVPDPANGQYAVVGAQHSYGTSFLTNNFYTTDRTFIGLAQPPRLENMLHLFVYETNAGPDTVTLLYANPTVPIQTNPPVSSVFALPAQSPPTFGVVWSGANYVGQASVAYYDIYVSDNGGPFTVWQSQTTATGALYDGTVGHTYAFYSLATDTAGNRETTPLQPQAQTTVEANTIPPTISVTSNVTLNAGQTLSLNVTASASNPQNSLTFALGPGAPAGVVVNPASGQITWATSPSLGGTTNLITLIATDNGQPPLSTTGVVQVVLRQVANPPVLAPIANYRIYEAQLLIISNSASDNNLPPKPLTFSLGPGAPTNATIDPIAGRFEWRPTAAQAVTQGPDKTLLPHSTNVFAVIVTDNGTPPLSATQQFTVIVTAVGSEYTLALGSTNLLVGATSSVPVTLQSSLPLTNLTTLLQVPTALLTNLTLLSVSPEILSTLLQPQGSNQYAITLALNPALSPGTSRTLAQLGFTAVAQTNSAIAKLLLPQISAVQADGEIAAKPAAYGGRIFVIGQQPLMDASLGNNGSRVLTIYGKPGSSYQIGYNTNLEMANWVPLGRLPMTNQSSVVSPDQSAPQIFYHAFEFVADPPIIDLNSVTSTNLGLLLYGATGSNYILQASTNLSLTNGWLSASALTLTNSFRFLGAGSPTNSGLYFRVKRP